MKFQVKALCLIPFIISILAAICWGEDLEPDADSIQNLAPKIYIDCRYCDEDYIKTEISYVNFVRDRKQADIHLFITQQSTGGGGQEFTVEFIGKHKYEGMADTLGFSTRETDTDDIIRNSLVKTIKLGLVRFLANTPLAEHLSVHYTQPTVQEEIKDIWNYWVFEIALNAYMNGEKSYHNLSLYGSVSVRRVTEQLKILLGFWANYQEYDYDYEDYKRLSLSRSRGLTASTVWSLTDHWSFGLWSDVYSSTYSNKQIDVSGAPGFEYNIFPYEQSTRRQLRFIYQLALKYVDYYEITKYDEVSEWLFRESVGIVLELIQPWGTVYTSLEAFNYMHDFRKNRLNLYSQLSLRIIEGLSFNISGSASRVRDQLSLRKRELSSEDVLLREWEFPTGYTYWFSLGISYSFGSIYNNIVNPRFGN